MSKETEIFNWLLGLGGDFPASEPGKRYGFRTELRKKLLDAGYSFDSESKVIEPALSSAEKPEDAVMGQYAKDIAISFFKWVEEMKFYKDYRGVYCTIKTDGREPDGIIEHTFEDLYEFFIRNQSQQP